MQPMVVWHGSSAEGREFAAACEHNCDCHYEDGIRTKSCTVHEAMVHEQRFADGMVFMRRMRACLERQEWHAR